MNFNSVSVENVQCKIKKLKTPLSFPFSCNICSMHIFNKLPVSNFFLFRVMFIHFIYFKDINHRSTSIIVIAVAEEADSVAIKYKNSEIDYV